MTPDIKELVKRLREPERPLNADRREAATALEAMAGEVERLTTNGIHTCHDQCLRLPCRQRREIRAITAERDRLKAALEAISEGDKPTTYMHLGTALAIARKALGDVS